MLFSSFVFLSFFLPIVLGAYYALPSKCRNHVLLVSSLVFYAWGDFDYLGILLGVVVLNYFGALILERISRDGVLRRSVMTVFVLLDVGVLFYFKYFDFVMSNAALLTGGEYVLRGIVMPLGISFYVFQSISYLVDVYRGEIEAQRNLLTLALFVSYFPQLVAGPILKYHDVKNEMESRAETLDHFVYGVRRFVMGLAKKVILANTLGQVADAVFGTDIGSFGVSAAWLGAVAYSLQLYFDFSGYSDMAIGLGAMFGFHFLENFNYPYLSKSISEFWRRWHISLSTWFKEYLYIPLGGNRVSKSRNLFNLGVVFLATGIWHGAEWTFVVWGAYHGVLILAEKLTGWHKTGADGVSSAAHRAYLLFAVIIGWVIFRSPTMDYALGYLGVMFGIRDVNPVWELAYYASPIRIMAMVIAVVLSAGPYRLVDTFVGKRTTYRMLTDVWTVFLFLLTITFLAGSSYNPFIYFRF